VVAAYPVLAWRVADSGVALGPAPAAAAH